MIFWKVLNWEKTVKFNNPFKVISTKTTKTSNLIIISRSPNMQIILKTQYLHVFSSSHPSNLLMEI